VGIKDDLRALRPLVGAWSMVADPVLAEAMASCGFHWQAVDMEHSPISIERAAACFIAIERRGVAPMARIPSPNPDLARLLLDAGAAGLIVSTVEDTEEFTRFSRRCLYPPNGTRGIGLSRCNTWGDDLDDYVQTFEPVLVAQIETAAGVEAVDAIAALPEVDALFIGPYDLSASLGDAGNFTTAEFAVAVETIRAAGIRNGKATGIHQVEPDPAALRARIAEGYTFVAYGTDATAMRYALGRPADIVDGAED